MRLKVAAVSINRNSFGLRSVVLISETGEGWQALSNDLYLPTEGEVVETGDLDVATALIAKNWECPERKLPDPPTDVVAIVWPTECFV